MAIRIAICDDSKTDAEFVNAALIQWAEKRNFVVHSHIFHSAECFLFHYSEDKDWDILLLDIEMGEIDGVTMAKKIRIDNEPVQIIFITGYTEYIAEGYEVAALHYLVKPLNAEKFFSVMDKAVAKRKKQDRFLNLEHYGEMLRIPLYEISYLDVEKNYVTVHGKNDYTVKRSLSDFMEELDNRFVRVGRSMIVNLNFIRKVTKSDLYLSDNKNTILPLPRGAYEPLNQAIIKNS